MHCYRSDGFQATLLQQACDSLALPLAQLYQSLFNSRMVPKKWDLAKVTPILKKGKSVDVSNYRPTPQTSLICKIMESKIKEDILANLLSKGSRRVPTIQGLTEVDVAQLQWASLGYHREPPPVVTTQISNTHIIQINQMHYFVLDLSSLEHAMLIF